MSSESLSGLKLPLETVGPLLFFLGFGGLSIVGDILQ